MAASVSSVCCSFYSVKPFKTLTSNILTPRRVTSSRGVFLKRVGFSLLVRGRLSRLRIENDPAVRLQQFSCNCFSAVSTNITDYEFIDSHSEVELRLSLGDAGSLTAKDISVDADGTSLIVRVQRNGLPVTLLETNRLFDRIKPADTIWYIDDDQLVVNMKKHDLDLKWPDIVESWESLSAGMMQLLKGASIYVVGDTTEVNQRVARELAVALGYTPLDTQEMLESFAKQSVESWLLDEGPDSVAEAESSVLESLSSHVRTVVSTIGGSHGAAGRTDRWRHLYAGFTVWVSQTEATDEDSAKEEAKRQKQDDALGYSKADVVVKLQGWDTDHAKSVAQASLSALKQLIISDKDLPGKKSLYIRLGCRGDWPNIKPPGWDPSTGSDSSVPPTTSR